MRRKHAKGCPAKLLQLRKNVDQTTLRVGLRLRYFNRDPLLESRIYGIVLLHAVALPDWAERKTIAQGYIEPALPMQNVSIEQLKGIFRLGVLDMCYREHAWPSTGTKMTPEVTS